MLHSQREMDEIHRTLVSPVESKVARILSHCGFVPCDIPCELRHRSSAHVKCKTAPAVWLAMHSALVSPDWSRH